MLYVVRHAHAVSEKEDPARPLSLQGVHQVRQLAAFFRGNGAFTATQLWHSPLVRARETAEKLAEGLKLHNACQEVAGLLPEDDPTELIDRLAEASTSRRIAVVGHEPHLSTLCTLLLHGRTAPAAFDLEKGAVALFDRAHQTLAVSDRPRWVLRWLVSPSLLPSEA